MINYYIVASKFSLRMHFKTAFLHCKTVPDFTKFSQLSYLLYTIRGVAYNNSTQVDDANSYLCE